MSFYLIATAWTPARPGADAGHRRHTSSRSGRPGPTTRRPGCSSAASAWRPWPWCSTSATSATGTGARGPCWPFCRAVVLCLLLLLLAEPVLRITETTPASGRSLWLLFDGTDSMAIADELPSAERAGLAAAVGLKRRTPTRQSRRHRRSTAASTTSRPWSRRPERTTCSQRLAEEVPPAGRSCSTRPRASARWSLPRRQGQVDAQAPGRAADHQRQGDGPRRGPGRPGPAPRHARTWRRGGLQRFQPERRPAGRSRRPSGWACRSTPSASAPPRRSTWPSTSRPPHECQEGRSGRPSIWSTLARSKGSTGRASA